MRTRFGEFGETDERELSPAVRRSGHIDRSVESCGENLAGVVRLTANIDNLFAVLATAGIRLIQRGC